MIIHTNWLVGILAFVLTTHICILCWLAFLIAAWFGLIKSNGDGNFWDNLKCGYMYGTIFLIVVALIFYGNFCLLNTYVIHK